MNGTLTRLIKLIGPLRWWIALVVLLSFGTLGATVGLMAMSAYLISQAALTVAFADIAVIVTGVRFFAISRAALRYTERYVGHLATFRILTRLRAWFYNSVEPLAPARLQTYHSGDLVARIGADIETLESFYVRVVVPPLAAALTALLASLILGAFDPAFAVALIAFMLLTGIVLPLLTLRASRTPANEQIHTRAMLSEVLTDEIQGLAEVLAYGQQTHMDARVRALGAQMDRAQLRLAHARGLSNALAVLFAGLAGLTILFLAIPLVTNGQIQGVFLALLPLTAIAAFEAVQPLGAALQQMEASRAAAKRLFELIDTPTVVPEPQEPQPLPTDFSIAFQNVSFRYEPDEPLALDGTSFSLAACGWLAVTGQSGAGKSTLVNLLLRFWDPQEGRVLIGGKDIRTLDSGQLRSLIGVASQHTHLFNGTLRDNLLLAKGDATDAELWQACEMAQVSEFVRSLPLGFDTLVGENGLKLSGGERQRLAIARVTLKNAPILILDEVTANLDALTEQKVMHALEPFMQGRTTIIISHRRAALAGAEYVLNLVHGHPDERMPVGTGVPDIPSMPSRPNDAGVPVVALKPTL